jgi:hypothetical protein
MLKLSEEAAGVHPQRWARFEIDEDAMANMGRPDGDDEQEPDSGRRNFEFSPVSARVPEGVARGVFSSNVMVVNGPSEFVLDFVLRLSHPYQLAARVILPKPVLPQFIGALEENLNMYREHFGSLPQQPSQQFGEPVPDSIDEIYEQLKATDEQLRGCYANAVMIGHSGPEYWFDFIANMVPRSVVTARIFMAAPQVIGLHDALVRMWKEFLEQQPPPSPPNEEDEGE